MVINDLAQELERISYDAYGRPRHHPLGDMDGNGTLASADTSLWTTLYNGGAGAGTVLDLNRDGVVNSTDRGLISNNLGTGLISGALSFGAIDNQLGYAGYHHHREMHIFLARHRWFDPELGRWLQRDPAGYIDGLNLYLYGLGSPFVFVDPMGLAAGDSKWNLCNWFNREPTANEKQIALMKARENGEIQPGENPEAAINEALNDPEVRREMAEYQGELAEAALEGAGEGLVHGSAMVANAATGGLIEPLDSHVNDLVEGYGGAYQFANASAQVGVELGMMATGMGVAGKVVDKGGDGVRWTREVLTRRTPGRDGATSRHIIERRNGVTNSLTHQVERDGRIIHQHQRHIGKHGTQRQFPNEWIEHPTVP